MDDTRPRPIATPLRLLWPLLAVATLLLVLVGALAGGSVWLLTSEPGTRWLLQRLPMVQADGVRGALLSSRFEADRLQVRWAGGQASLTITQLRAEGLVWQWRPVPGAWVGLDAARLAAQDVTFVAGPPSGQPMALPASLASPLRLRIDAVAIDTLRVGTLAPLRGLQGRVALGVDGQHRIDAIRLDWDRLQLQGRLQMADTTPFALDGELGATTLAGAPGAAAGPAVLADVAATLRAGGTLARVEATATVRGSARDGLPAPSADLQATLLPFAPWPLAALSAETRALDLAVFASTLPQTRLSGSAQVQSSAVDAPIGARVQLDNALPGRWNEGRLPLRSLALELRASTGQRQQVDLTQFEAVLGTLQHPGGRWIGSGQWLAHTLTLQTTLQAVQPQRLDGRAAAMALSGPLNVTLQGLPSPDPAQTAAPPARALTLNTTLDGRLDGAPQAVQLELDAHADDSRIEIRQLRAHSGNTLAQARASATPLAGGAWQLASAGTLTEFDPLPWWPGEAGSAWRQGPHRLSGSWQLDLRLPGDIAGKAPLAWVPRLAGNGTLRLSDSVLAGVPLSAALTLAQKPGVSPPSTLVGTLQMAGNTLKIDGSGDPGGSGSNDRLRLDLDARMLAGLGPLLKLHPALADWAPRGGTVTASLTAQGRWPDLHTEGEVDLQQLQSGPLAVDQGTLRWNFDTGGLAQEPLEAEARLSGLRWGTQRVEQLRADLRGTWRSHDLLLTAALPATPPALAEQLLAVRAGAGTRAQLQASGAWQPAGGGGGTWRGQVQRLAVGSWDGATLSGDTRANWLDARDLRATLQFGSSGALEGLQAEPGRVQLADAMALRWDAVRIAPVPGGLTQIDLNAELDPFFVAPLLARAQPDMGWGGDLRVKGKLQVRAAERFDADLVIERADGDLTLRDDAGLQLLGLTDLRLGLAAHDGQWVFTQALAGRTLGEMAGALSVRTTPQARWPGPDAPVDGVVEARVANLGVWGTWVPPGWRLGGQLRTSATVGGRFGAPEYTGQVTGSDLSVRNLLQGVNITQGSVAVTLAGETARIESFSLKGGEGTLRVTGGASFGATPNAKLQVVADRFRLLGRIDRQLSTSGSADVLLQRDLIRVDGRFGIDEGLFDTSRGNAPSLDDDVNVRRASTEIELEEATPVPRSRRTLAVTLAVDLGEQLRVKGRGLDTTLRGQLRITTPGGRLQINGTVNTDSGSYAAYGQKLAIERGIVAFSGPPDNPRLDILALRPNIDMGVGVSITGTVQSPRVRLYSDIDMSDTDKLSWLVLGRAPDGLGRTDTALLQRAAVALLSGEGEAPTDALLKSLGIDELSLRQSDGDVRETVITLGKQLSRRWYVGYERSVNATAGTWQLIYRIAQRFTLRAQSGLENSLDIIWTWRFDEVPIPSLPRLPGTDARPPAAPASAGGMTKSAPQPP